MRCLLICAGLASACSSSERVAPSNHSTWSKTPDPLCGLGEVASIEERTRTRMLHGDSPRLGTCEIASARDTERWQIREHGTLVAEVIFDCGIVAYDARLAYGGVRVGNVAETVPGNLVCSTGTLRLPDDAFAGARDYETALIACTLLDRQTIFIVRAAPDPQRPEKLEGAAARQLVGDKPIVAVYDYTCSGG
jgi:hypothetical protein